jgi:hypothetical protein
MLFTIATRMLETMFVVGVIGCVIVLVLTTVEDIRMLLEREEKK